MWCQKLGVLTTLACNIFLASGINCGYMWLGICTSYYRLLYDSKLIRVGSIIIIATHAVINLVFALKLASWQIHQLAT